MTKTHKNKKPSIANRAWERGNRRTINPLSCEPTAKERNNESVTHLAMQQWKDRRGVRESLGTLDTMRNAQTRACLLVMESKTVAKEKSRCGPLSCGDRRNSSELQAVAAGAAGQQPNSTKCVGEQKVSRSSRFLPVEILQMKNGLSADWFRNDTSEHRNLVNDSEHGHT
jgi:hypothetical protein